MFYWIYESILFQNVYKQPVQKATQMYHKLHIAQSLFFYFIFFSELAFSER